MKKINGNGGGRNSCFVLSGLQRTGKRAGGNLGGFCGDGGGAGRYRGGRYGGGRRSL